MTNTISDEEFEKKIIKLRRDIEESRLEADRRKAVAQSKMYGFLIEYIDSEREKLAYKDI